MIEDNFSVNGKTFKQLREETKSLEYAQAYSVKITKRMLICGLSMDKLENFDIDDGIKFVNSQYYQFIINRWTPTILGLIALVMSIILRN